jgi:CRISPR-associated protein Cas2
MPRPGTMTYLFCYDFPSTPGGDRRRARVARRLEGLGLRVQYSVFEIEMPPEKLPLILATLSEIMLPEDDSLRIYGLCHTCREKVINLGREAPCEYGPLLIW